MNKKDEKAIIRYQSLFNNLNEIKSEREEWLEVASDKNAEQNSINKLQIALDVLSQYSKTCIKSLK